MHAMVLEEVGKPLVPAELPNPKLPLVPGHEVVGQIESVGSPDISLQNGQMVGIPWLAWTCGACEYCRAGLENLCEQARFHGYTVDGGYAEYMVADARYCFPLPDCQSASKFEQVSASNFEQFQRGRERRCL